ncbi:MAG TPA: hypothetical protein VFI50_08790 [Casimicrobiaceae bacterium]|jgi:hypothetical protein|nr:hypothetical protein [Casimicrobiaceae bacterium]
MEHPMMQRVMWVIWPAFLTAIGAEVVFFALFDPLDFNMRLSLSREAVYTFGFAAFWLLGALSSAMTLLLQRPVDDTEPLPL